MRICYLLFQLSFEKMYKCKEVLLMKRSVALKKGLPILGVFRSFEAVGVDPAVMGIDPAVAIPVAVRVLESLHASYVESGPFKYITMFTVFQLVYFLICYGITWIPTGGILFPLPFFLLIPIREHFLPKLFPPEHLQELDASEYEEFIGRPVQSMHLYEVDRFILSCSHRRIVQYKTAYYSFYLPVSIVYSSFLVDLKC